MYVFFFTLLCCFNFNHISGSLNPLGIFYKEKSKTRFNLGQLVTIISGLNL